MKFLVTTAAVGMIAAGIGSAWAQDVLLGPERETVIREYVIQQRVDPVELPPGVEISVGTVLPDEVELYAIEAPDLGDSYDYVPLNNGQTLVVDPDTRQIVDVLEQ
ncbi:uncharacterized protein DUF1236 [Pseudaminobacter salicylatoxidans]|uniref:Uncharacterized protein DUF1236 n=1 Tax=Pseudaminobacter salicylatoxidans TaxID=93369 RepID=A0A316BU40_PSESE|nr:DUF1236 domain-containing protein [Pseudaminobacter salicylatoxidans]PWJ76920.1 uncharacterized protein DUF1236 [Pseudaminobacter salicylatoxidans]